MENKVQAPNISIPSSRAREFSLAGVPIKRQGIIIGPNGNSWESKSVINAAAVRNDSIHIFYRAFGPDDPLYSRIEERPSSIGHATSKDGITIEDRLEEPIIKNAEDPRITDFGRTYVMTYTEVVDFRRPNNWTTYVTIAVSNNLMNFKRLGKIETEGLEKVNKNVALFPRFINGRYAALARQKPDIFTVYSDDLIHWDNPKLTMQPRRGYWDSNYIGTGIPPIETPIGWLNIYHGVDKGETYRLGVALHDLNDPSIVLARSKEPLLEPQEDYETKGIKGKPPHANVVYTCGGVEMNGLYFIYYGAADQVLALATVPIKHLQERIMKT